MQSAVTKETLGSRLSRGPVATLNAVYDEGWWELVNGSFVFVETGQQSHDKFMSSGQQVAIAGTVMSYYLFKRNETNKVRGADPWELDDQQAVELADEVEGCTFASRFTKRCRVTDHLFRSTEIRR
jgi:hypothetical protein